jgi:transcriptional regulator with XRE-family HTH domain
MLSINQKLANRVRVRRKEGKLSQTALAERSGVSLGSIKRFELTGEISLSSLVRIAFVLGFEDDFEQLFARKNYQSLDEMINEK